MVLLCSETYSQGLVNPTNQLHAFKDEENHSSLLHTQTSYHFTLVATTENPTRTTPVCINFHNISKTKHYLYFSPFMYVC